MEALGFSIYSIVLSTNSDNFPTSYPAWMSFISFSCLIVVTRTDNTMLNRSGQSGHVCLHDWERMYTRGGFMSMYGKTKTVS